MNDEHYTDDSQLDARLRAGLTALVDEAPEPPPLPVSGPARSSRRPLVLAAAVLLLVIAVIGAAVATRRDTSSNVTSGANQQARVQLSESALADTNWELTRATIAGPGQSEGRSAHRTPTLSFSRCVGTATQRCVTRLRVAGNDGCNAFGGFVRVRRHEIELVDMSSTAMACLDRLSGAVGGLLSDGTVAASMDGRSLRLRGNGADLVYRRTAVLPTVRGSVLADGRRGGVIYRLSWERAGRRGHLRFDHATIDRTLQARITVSLGEVGGTMEDTGATDIAIGSYAWGLAPLGTVRVVAVVGGRSIELPTYALAGTDGQRAFGKLVDAAPSALVAYDSTGRELGRNQPR